MFIIDHVLSPCLNEQLGRNSDGHSKIFGFAKDGFPIYGPFQTSSTYAKSCWALRDYNSQSTGCASGGRTCVLNDPFDPTQGVSAASPHGPSFTATITTPSGTTFQAKNGVFFEDYYYDKSCKTSEAINLDQYNGHAHGNYPYHYHLTMSASGRAAAFPYAVGPKFYGCLSQLTPNSQCSKRVKSNYGAVSVGGTSTCGISTMKPSTECMDSVYSLYQPTLAPAPTPRPTAQVAPIVQFTSKITLDEVPATELDSSSKKALINATATVMEVRSDDVSITSQKSTQVGGFKSIAIKLMAPTSYTIEVVVDVSLNTVDYGNANPNTLLESKTNKLQTAARTGALTTEINNAATIFGSNILQNINVIDLGITTFSIVTPPSSNSDSDELSGGAIAGIVIAVIIVVILIATGIYYYVLWQRTFGPQSPQKVNTDEPIDVPPAEATEVDEKGASAPVAVEVEAEQQVVQVDNAQAV